MDLSIVIVNWNTRDLLQDCLNTVFGAFGNLKVEVLVVDNASTDNSVEMVKSDFPEVTLFTVTKNLGFAGGNNIALEHAVGRYVLLLNTDTLVHGDVLEQTIEWLDAKPEVGVMGPRVLNTDGTVQASCSAFPSLKYLGLQALGITRIPKFDNYRMTGWDRSSVREVEVISGAAMFVRRAAIKEIGLLDEAFFFYGEETDWCRRFGAAGWKLVYAPIPEITHFGGGSVRKLNHRRDVMKTQGTTRLHLKHGGVAAAIVCFIILLFHNASRAAMWSVLDLLGRPNTSEKATHFRAVTREFPFTWPRQQPKAGAV